MSSNVVAFPGLNLSDMSACLRRLAENIDAGLYPDASALIVVMPVENEFPMAFGFGADEQLGSLAVIAQLEMAKAWFINHVTSR